MKGTRFYKIVIAILIVINVATLSFMWFRRPPHPPKPGERAQLSIKLGLEGDSKARVNALEKEHHEAKRNLMGKDRELHSQMFDNIFNEQAPDKLQLELDQNKSEIEKMTFEFFKAVAKECNEEQKVELRELINHALNNLMGRPPKPGQKPRNQ